MSKTKTDKQTAMESAFRMHEEGKIWSEITAILQQRGHVSSKGTPYSESTIKNEYSKAKKSGGWPLPVLPSEPTEHNDHSEGYERVEPDTFSLRNEGSDDNQMAKETPYFKRDSLSYEDKEGYEQNEPTVHTRLDYEHNARYDENSIRELVEQLVDERVNTIMNINTAMRTTDRQTPPEPQTIRGAGKGRRETRHYERVSLTVDKELWTLFQQSMQKEGISSAGRMIDVILWRYYGRPRLSFEAETNNENTKQPQ